ncbi:pseudouridine synthase [Rossellomorea marisflavi]|uniref:Pseudouridine synthase n=1 Tax=Rossellomorea marisflavi TaxID=189381 RepID=A0A0J5VJ62_9BACI|nr:pseudouridine synthase [Rossellomorea marisflavi]KMK93644.1 pseudouridine synthase [Rossellomorea marisflavi]KML01419.1 pseudouridine synthase [Rossellomorea marisflavi]KML34845.1 pseudouridine synthase [Rossellomorea marisflavi]KON91505.1 pseudouridine synthase [Rossellomorea marisflavi]KZE45644.1 pseudouridine synthase [Rossellomorea marisflavi]
MERLQKVIAHSGVASRRKAEQLIIEGKVKVNGKVVKELGTKVAASDRVDVSGVQIERENKVYYMLYKPRSVISAVTDDKNRQVVTDFFQEIDERIYPIGRLDYETSGLLLLTNDGEFANLLMHPSNEIEKTYVARVKGIPSKFKLKELEKGVKLEDGRTAPAKVKMLSMDKKQGKSIIEITIHEGRNRQVRRMFEHIGYPVQKLKRERYGSLTLQGLTAGEGRELTPHEVKQLRTLAESAANK